MALFSNADSTRERTSKGILGAFSVDVIKWEPETDQEASLIVHKFEAEDFPSGSQLIVHPSQMAVFINNLSAGNSLDASSDEGKSQVAIFVGPCKIRLETGDSRWLTELLPQLRQETLELLPDLEMGTVLCLSDEARDLQCFEALSL